MEQETPKTANQLYRESGSTLSFKEWIEREKAKGTEMINQEIADAIARLQAGEPQTQDVPNTTWYGLKQECLDFWGIGNCRALLPTLFIKNASNENTKSNNYWRNWIGSSLSFYDEKKNL
jgi:hypothetical protein